MFSKTTAFTLNVQGSKAAKTADQVGLGILPLPALRVLRALRATLQLRELLLHLRTISLSLELTTRREVAIRWDPQTGGKPIHTTLERAILDWSTGAAELRPYKLRSASLSSKFKIERAVGCVPDCARPLHPSLPSGHRRPSAAAPPRQHSALSAPELSPAISLAAIVCDFLAH